MGTIAFAILGGVVGWLAGMVVKTDPARRLTLEVSVGAAGAVLGGWVYNVACGDGLAVLNAGSLATAVLGAVVLLVFVRANTTV